MRCASAARRRFWLLARELARVGLLDDARQRRARRGAASCGGDGDGAEAGAAVDLHDDAVAAAQRQRPRRRTRRSGRRCGTGRRRRRSWAARRCWRASRRLAWGLGFESSRSRGASLDGQRFGSRCVRGRRSYQHTTSSWRSTSRVARGAARVERGGSAVAGCGSGSAASPRGSSRGRPVAGCDGAERRVEVAASPPAPDRTYRAGVEVAQSGTAPASRAIGRRPRSRRASARPGHALGNAPRAAPRLVGRPRRCASSTARTASAGSGSEADALAARAHGRQQEPPGGGDEHQDGTRPGGSSSVLSSAFWPCSFRRSRVVDDADLASRHRAAGATSQRVSSRACSMRDVARSSSRAHDPAGRGAYRRRGGRHWAHAPQASPSSGAPHRRSAVEGVGQCLCRCRRSGDSRSARLAGRRPGTAQASRRALVTDERRGRSRGPPETRVHLGEHPPSRTSSTGPVASSTRKRAGSRGGEGAETRPDALVERDRLGVEAVAAADRGRARCRPTRDRAVEQEGEIRRQPAAGAGVAGADGVQIEAAAVSLVGDGRVGEAIAEDDAPAASAGSMTSATCCARSAQ